MNSNDNPNDGFTINVNSPGNFIAKEITFSGTVNIGQAGTESGGYTDEQIARAITAINGKGKPLSSKLRWAAVHWCLRWYCNFPPSAKDFCDRVAELPLGKLEYECDYNSLRRWSTLSFMDQDCRSIDKVKPSRQDTEPFRQCREVVIALAAELGKAALPQVRL